MKEEKTGVKGKDDACGDLHDWPEVLLGLVLILEIIDFFCKVIDSERSSLMFDSRDDHGHKLPVSLFLS